MRYADILDEIFHRAGMIQCPDKIPLAPFRWQKVVEFLIETDRNLTLHHDIGG